MQILLSIFNKLDATNQAFSFNKAELDQDQMTADGW